jgi:hypothetical protein
MKLPSKPDLYLPYFEYGFFKKDEPAFKDIEPYVNKDSIKEYHAEGTLIIADGMPLYDPDTEGKGVHGFLLTFKEGMAQKAYALIDRFVPPSLFDLYMKIATVSSTRYHVLRVNKKGITEYLARGDYEQDKWNGKEDPMFKEAMDHIGDIISRYKSISVSSDSLNAYADSWNCLFELQKAYMLLNAVFERFLFFRYGFIEPSKISEHEKKFSSDPIFKKALKSFSIEENRVLFDFRELPDSIILNSNDSRQSLRYYRQIRHNLIHRGKTDFDNDAAIMQKSLGEFYKIVKKILEESYKEKESLSKLLAVTP